MSATGEPSGTAAKAPTTSPVSFARKLERLRYAVRHPFRYRLLQSQARTIGGIFVHIPKCAGTAIRESLGFRSGGHRTLLSYQTMLPAEVFERSFKFTFVRNPWDRVASAFFFLKNKDLKGNRKWERENISQYETLDAFIRGWITRENIWTYSHFRPQYHFITLDGQTPAVDFIGFYENLAEDFAHIAKKLKINTALRESNRNPKRERKFQDSYTDETRRLVAEAYAEDIALFGYTFDGPLNR